MANTETALKEALTSIEGATGAALVDYTSGMALGTMGGSKSFDLNVAAAGNTDVVRAKLRTMEHLGLKDEIEDILITLVRPVPPDPAARRAAAATASSSTWSSTQARQPGDGPPPAEEDRGGPGGLTA